MEEYQLRKIGDALVFIRLDEQRENHSIYEGRIVVGETVWVFNELYSPDYWGKEPYSDAAYDVMAASAASFGSGYTSNNRKNVPRWAPSAEDADAIYEATSWAYSEDYEGPGFPKPHLYTVERLISYTENPKTFTTKGERMYEHIKDSYIEEGTSEGEAKGFAAATVYARAEEGATGLVKNPRLTAEERDELPGSKFAIPELRKLPIEDKGHVRSAMARFGQTHATLTQKKKAYRRIVRAADKFDIDPEGFVDKHENYYGRRVT